MDTVFPRSSDPSPLTHSWPLFERDQRFDLGGDFGWRGGTLIDPSLDERTLADQGLGIWECDLVDSRDCVRGGLWRRFTFQQAFQTTLSDDPIRTEIPDRSMTLRLACVSSQ